MGRAARLGQHVGQRVPHRIWLRSVPRAPPCQRPDCPCSEYERAARRRSWDCTPLAVRDVQSSARPWCHRHSRARPAACPDSVDARRLFVSAAGLCGRGKPTRARPRQPGASRGRVCSGRERQFYLYLRLQSRDDLIYETLMLHTPSQPSTGRRIPSALPGTEKRYDRGQHLHATVVPQ
jgi:hypothetical protein